MKGNLEQLVREVVSQYLQQNNLDIPVGVSNRHVHLSQDHLEQLFGHGYQGVKYRDLNQPGQFAFQETITLVGPKGIIENVRILGPTRCETQVEILAGDTFKLGVPIALRDSGDVVGTPGIALVGSKGVVQLERGVIVARRHIHLNPVEANLLKVQDGQLVKIAVSGGRGLEFHGVKVRVHRDYRAEFHIDIEEANASQLTNGDTVKLA